MTPRRICFVAPQAYSVMARDRQVEVVGGAEVQQATLARELARRGHEVSMVCLDYGQPDPMQVDGVVVHRAHRPDEGVPGLRFLHPRLTSLWRAMRRADADIYYQRAAGALTGIVAAFARAHGRRFVFAGAADFDFDTTLPLIPLARDRALYLWGVRRADALVVQHPDQQRACSSMLGRDSRVIRSAYAHRGGRSRHEGDVLWVGSVKPQKAPEVLIRLARALPRWRFRMVGGGDRAYVESLRRSAADVPNLHFAGFVPHADVESQFDAAALLVNTSPAEGFPNTFLQAWSRAIPTVSFVDPQLGWQGRPAGAVARTEEEMAAVVERWKSDRTLWQDQGLVCLRTFEATFSIEHVIDRYESLFDQLLLAGRRCSPAVQSVIE